MLDRNLVEIKRFFMTPAKLDLHLKPDAANLFRY